MVNGRAGGVDSLPKPGLIDFLSRTDELLIELRRSVVLLAQGMGIRFVQNASGQDIAIKVGSTDGVSIGGFTVGGYQLMPPKQIFDTVGMYETSKTYYPSQLADIIQAENVLIIVKSSLDQAVTVQAIGCLAEQGDGNNTFNIESSQSLAAASDLGLGVDLSSNWYPYIGVSVATGGTPPTTGHLDAWVYQRKKL